MILTHHGINSFRRSIDRGVLYYTDFRNFDEENKIDHPIIGPETSYAGLNTIQFTKETIDNKNWLYLKTLSSFSQVGTNGISLDISDKDIISFEFWFELLNLYNSYQATLYTWFPRGINTGYMYDTYFSYGTPGINGFCCDGNHNNVDLYNGTTFSNVLSHCTKFDTNINRTKVNLACVYDRNANENYMYLNGNLCVKNKNYPTLDTFRFYPHNNSQNVDCRITNLILTNTDKRSADKMTFAYTNI